MRRVERDKFTPALLAIVEANSRYVASGKSHITEAEVEWMLWCIGGGLHGPSGCDAFVGFYRDLRGKADAARDTSVPRP